MKKVVFFLAIVILAIGYFLYRHHQETEGLKNFYKLTQEDPLFYSPFFDSKEWDKSIKALKSSEDELEKVSIEVYPKAYPNASKIEKDDYASALITNSLFPYPFLQNLISINQKTNEFLKNPSSALGKELLSLYDDAADSYIKDVESKIAALEKIDKKNKIMNEYIIFIDSISSYRVVLNDFLTIKENGYKLKEEVGKRKGCLSGEGSCLVLPQDDKKIDDFVDSFNAKFDLKGENIDFIKNSYPTTINPKKISGPYKIKSLCWRSPHSEQWMYLYYFVKENGKIFMLPKLATQNYYQKIPKSNAKINKALLEKGFIFEHQLESAPYRCLDSAFYPQLLTLDFVKKQIDSDKTIQNSLIKRDYELLIKNQFGLMAPIINLLSETIRSLKLNIMVNRVPPPEEYLLAVRTTYSILFFPFAKSIWRVDKNLQYVIPKEEWPAKNSPEYFTIDNLKKLGYNEEEIKKFDPGNIIIFYESLL